MCGDVGDGGDVVADVVDVGDGARDSLNVAVRQVQIGGHDGDREASAEVVADCLDLAGRGLDVGRDSDEACVLEHVVSGVSDVLQDASGVGRDELGADAVDEVGLACEGAGVCLDHVQVDGRAVAYRDKV